MVSLGGRVIPSRFLAGNVSAPQVFQKSFVCRLGLVSIRPAKSMRDYSTNGVLLERGDVRQVGAVAFQDRIRDLVDRGAVEDRFVHFGISERDVS